MNIMMHYYVNARTRRSGIVFKAGLDFGEVERKCHEIGVDNVFIGNRAVTTV